MYTACRAVYNKNTYNINLKYLIKRKKLYNACRVVYLSRHGPSSSASRSLVTSWWHSGHGCRVTQVARPSENAGSWQSDSTMWCWRNLSRRLVTHWVGDTLSWWHIELVTHWVGDTLSWWHIELVTHWVGDTLSWGHIELGTHWVGDTLSWWHIELGTHWVGDTLSWWHIELVTHWVGDTLIWWHWVGDTLSWLVTHWVGESSRLADLSLAKALVTHWGLTIELVMHFVKSFIQI